MYPLPEGMYAARNQWYIAAWSKEVTREPMERWILDEPIAFYRTQAGKAIALNGRCPHRHFPLGKSAVVGDNIECGYHGIQFRPDGSAASVPSQTTAPTACNVQAYPLVEKWQWLWIWPGDPALADESLIPDHDEIRLTDSNFESCGGTYYSVPARYMLMHDNLFDLTHLNVLHRTSIGSGDLASTKEIRTLDEKSLTSFRNFKDMEMPAYYSSAMGYKGKCNREVNIKFFFPCLHFAYSRFTRASTVSDQPGAHVGQALVYHAITPATRHTAHYFFAMSRDFARDDDALGQKLLSKLLPTLDEDMFATGEIEKMITRLGYAPKEILLKSDTTCGHGRKLFENAIRRELDSVESSRPGVIELRKI